MSFDSGDSFPKVDMLVYGQQIVCCVGPTQSDAKKYVLRPVH